MVYGIIVALAIVGLTLFASFWIPSDRAGLDQKPTAHSARKTMFLYVIVFIGTIVPLLTTHFIVDGTVVLSLGDFAIACGVVLVITPVVRKMMQAAKARASRK